MRRVKIDFKFFVPVLFLAYYVLVSPFVLNLTRASWGDTTQLTYWIQDFQFLILAFLMGFVLYRRGERLWGEQRTWWQLLVLLLLGLGLAYLSQLGLAYWVKTTDNNMLLVKMVRDSEARGALPLLKIMFMIWMFCSQASYLPSCIFMVVGG